MENQVILLDTNILIDYFRKTKKEYSTFHRLSLKNKIFAISVVTHFEILRGITQPQELFWKLLLNKLNILPYTPSINVTAVSVLQNLKPKRKSISFEDLIIASTALHFQYSLATLNTRHFNNIDGLDLIELS
jgi:predicted nucleic acid-binding protein